MTLPSAGANAGRRVRLSWRTGAGSSLRRPGRARLSADDARELTRNLQAKAPGWRIARHDRQCVQNIEQAPEDDLDTVIAKGVCERLAAANQKLIELLGQDRA